LRSGTRIFFVEFIINMISCLLNPSFLNATYIMMKWKQSKKTTDRTVPKSKRTNRGGGGGVETVCLGDWSKIDIPNTK